MKWWGGDADAFCDEEGDSSYPNKKKNYWWAHDPESDEELKEKGCSGALSTTTTTTTDLAVPSGFVAREAGDDE